MTAKDEVDDRRIDLALHELLGGEHCPDLAEGIAARLRSEGGHRTSTSHRARHWLTAALIALGIGVIWMVSRGSSTAHEAAIGPPQDPPELPPPVRAEPAQLDGLPADLQNLVLIQPRDDDLAALSRFRGLRALEITKLPSTNGVSITDAGMERIAALDKLQVLRLLWCREITGAGLASLERLPMLQSLGLVACRLGTEDLAALARLPGLRALQIPGGTEIRDEALDHVTRLVNLRSLDLDTQTWLTPDGLVKLRALHHLEELDLGRVGAWLLSSRLPPPEHATAGVDDGVLEALGELRQLQVLRLSMADKVTGEGLSHLRDLSRLRIVDLSHLDKIQDPDLLALRGPIEELNLTFCAEITGHGLATFGKVRKLTLDGCAKLEDAALTEMPTDELRELSLRDCTQLRGEIIASLPDFHRLWHVDLARCGFVRDEHLQTLAKLHELRVLSLDGDPLVTDAGLAHLRDLDKLEDLDLRANPNVTVDGLRQLEGLKLRRLTIAACKAIDIEDSRRLEAEWKDCVFVR
ncbi:MAG: hypothetical protein U1F36_08710 [Planctomycetota bacterium]